jgi:glycosyltransferase involved in cell wall biosynthesis
MTTTPLISIAVCTYNGAKFLTEQLDTLVNQTYPNLEIVIVDDVSKDNTLAILNDYATRYSNIRVIQNEQNLGYIKNFEKAITLCRGHYIALSDQDDVWDLEKISLLYNAIGDSMLIYHDSEFIDDNGKLLGKKISDIVNMYSGDSPIPFFFFNCVSGHACLFKKELVKLYGSFDPQFHHDWWIALVAAYYGHIKYMNSPLVKYRQHSTTSTDILGIQEKENKVVTPRFSEIKVGWLKNVTRIPELKPYIDSLLTAYPKRSFVGKFQLMALLLKHDKQLFALKKKSRISSINYIRRLSFSDYRDGQ